ncbi:MAG: cob(I)yrinic acid a,c-diamide adenosyltransferase [Candidatus Omnitrophica bacterium]|nr:cob(I)yrinic acid a,c-diamide adenosyltransferase [Candidatus Omnitrophota bacterium]MCF7878242.1 cob(I)yrinic acid a,c-diamide adenosyltransferase [Candidatus Omnitrophota bacterium]
MSIVTKNGDKGKTSFCKGKRVYKDHPCVEACGNIDELNSYLGFAKVQLKKRKDKEIINQIQKDLFLICAEIVTDPKQVKKITKRIDKGKIKKIEELIENLENKIKLKKDFYIPGKNLKSASLDIARVVARRTERRVVSLNKKSPLKNTDVLVYLNRLSDLLFLLARVSGNKSHRS